MAEWSIAAVLKTVELRGSGGSNPSLSANKLKSLNNCSNSFFVASFDLNLFKSKWENKKEDYTIVLFFNLLVRRPAAAQGCTNESE